MPQPGQTFKAITCQHCRTIIVMATLGSFTHTTHLRCPVCQQSRTIRPQEMTEQAEPQASARMPVPVAS